MENITNYCDEIYEILCSLDKNTNTATGLFGMTSGVLLNGLS